MERKATAYDVVDGVATLTLARPHRRNAWTGRMHHEYRVSMTEAEVDPAVRVVVVTGAEGAFCVGGDSEALSGHAARGAYDDGLRSDPPMPDVPADFAEDFAFQLAMSTPVIASVNGAAAGVGLAVACFADIRYAVTGAKLTTAAPKLGLPAEYGLSWLLPRLVGAGRAADWLITGRVFTTDEAGALGLFSDVVAPEALAGTVAAAATELARHVSPASAATAKRQLWTELLGGTPAASVARSKQLLRDMVGSADFVEGTRALTERRRPTF